MHFFYFSVVIIEEVGGILFGRPNLGPRGVYYYLGGECYLGSLMISKHMHIF